MPSYAKLYAATKVMKGLRLLEIVNASESRASRITVQMTTPADGADVSYFVEDVPRSIEPRARVTLVLSSAPGPRDVDVSLQWDDPAGLPGVWHGVVRRY